MAISKAEKYVFAMHCWKCKKFELPEEEFEQTEYQQKCEKNIQKIIDNLEIKEN